MHPLLTFVCKTDNSALSFHHDIAVSCKGVLEEKQRGPWLSQLYTGGIDFFSSHSEYFSIANYKNRQMFCYCAHRIFTTVKHNVVTQFCELQTLLTEYVLGAHQVDISRLTIKCTNTYHQTIKFDYAVLFFLSRIRFCQDQSFCFLDRTVVNCCNSNFEIKDHNLETEEK